MSFYDEDLEISVSICEKCAVLEGRVSSSQLINPLRLNSDLSQTSHCSIKGLSVREVMRIENMITQVKFH